MCPTPYKSVTGISELSDMFAIQVNETIPTQFWKNPHLTSRSPGALNQSLGALAESASVCSAQTSSLKPLCEILAEDALTRSQLSPLYPGIAGIIIEFSARRGFENGQPKPCPPEEASAA